MCQKRLPMIVPPTYRPGMGLVIHISTAWHVVIAAHAAVEGLIAQRRHLRRIERRRRFTGAMRSARLPKLSSTPFAQLAVAAIVAFSVSAGTLTAAAASQRCRRCTASSSPLAAVIMPMGSRNSHHGIPPSYPPPASSSDGRRHVRDLIRVVVVEDLPNAAASSPA